MLFKKKFSKSIIFSFINIKFICRLGLSKDEHFSRYLRNIQLFILEICQFC